MQYTVHQAKTHLSRQIKEVEEGKEVIIARGSKVVARLVPEKPAKRPKRVPGIFEGKGWAAPDAFDPVSDEELKEWGLL
jgi:antitoxin (DNA-binding transcriptional repressor) of toxin-antitoxin stability system